MEKRYIYTVSRSCTWNTHVRRYANSLEKKKYRERDRERKREGERDRASFLASTGKTTEKKIKNPIARQRVGVSRKLVPTWRYCIEPTRPRISINNGKAALTTTTIRRLSFRASLPPTPPPRRTALPPHGGGAHVGTIDCVCQAFTPGRENRRIDKFDAAHPRLRGGVAHHRPRPFISSFVLLFLRRRPTTIATTTAAAATTTTTAAAAATPFLPLSSFFFFSFFFSLFITIFSPFFFPPFFSFLFSFPTTKDEAPRYAR